MRRKSKREENYYVMVKIGEWKPMLSRSLKLLAVHFDFKERIGTKWKKVLSERDYLIEGECVLMKGDIIKDTRGGETSTSGRWGKPKENNYE
jgi:hypothetical protein